MTINCDLDVKKVTLDITKTTRTTLKLCTFSSTTHYYNNRFRHNIQCKVNIACSYNVTVDDLRLYYCVTKVVSPKYSNDSRLHIFVEFSQ